MAEIRKQSIVSTIIIYIGFFIGFLNVYFFTKQGYFTEEEYGLTGIFIAIANMMFAFANMGMMAVVYKFYPYYTNNLPTKKIDLTTWAIAICIAAFSIVCLVGILFKDVVVRKFSANSILLIQYYEWTFMLGFGLTLFSILEALAWSVKQSVTTNLLRETVFRLCTSLLIILFIVGLIKSFKIFIILFSFSYLIITIILFIKLLKNKHLQLTTTVSTVTRKFKKKMLALAGFTYLGTVIYIVAQFIDSVIIASLLGLKPLGIFTLSSTIAGLVQVPQRGIVSATVANLSESWRVKDYATIQRIYQRSSINLLIAALGIFLVIWLNYTDLVVTLQLKPAYLAGKWLFFFLGIAKLVDMGTGVNGQIISTSTFWRFEFICGCVLLSLIIPLNYLLVKQYGMLGAAYSNLISFSIYNTIRIIFLWKKFRMQPFSLKSLYTIILGIVCYCVAYYVGLNITSWLGMIFRGTVFLSLYSLGVFYLKLSPDVMQLYHLTKEKLGIK